MSPEDQRFTLRELRRTDSIIDSHGLVDPSVCLSFPRMPRRVRVSVSSIPSRSEAAAPGCERSSSSASSPRARRVRKVDSALDLLRAT